MKYVLLSLFLINCHSSSQVPAPRDKLIRFLSGDSIFAMYCKEFYAGTTHGINCCVNSTECDNPFDMRNIANVIEGKE